MIASTLEPPYYAVIFTSVRTEVDSGYSEAAKRMGDLASKQAGFLGMESARNDIGITISYWDSLEAIKKWKAHAEHLIVQQMGKDVFYRSYKTRVCKVERDYGFEK